jgi:hypothetical protein
MIDYLASFTNTNSVAFPDTEAVNVSAPGAGDGTEFVALLVNDIWGRVQALMDYAGLTPDGVMEAPGTAQIIEALCKGLGVGPGMGVIYWKNDTPAALGDRVLLLQGQVILIATYPLLAAAVYCGDANNATAPAFYKTSDAGGTTRSTAGTYLVLPDTRGLSLKGVGNATVNTRTKTGPAALGEVQEDQIETHEHNLNIGTSGGAAYTDGDTQGLATVASTPTQTQPAFRTKNLWSGDTARNGSNTRDSTIGTNFGITY